MLKPDEIITVTEAVPSKKHCQETSCFAWTNFKGHIMDQVNESLRDEKFVDVTIYCENRYFKAHKLILCGASPFLKTLLEDCEVKEPSISLVNVPWLHFTWLLQFIYSGQVLVPEEEFPEFLTTATLLQVTSLSKKPQPAVKRQPMTRSSKTEIIAKSVPAKTQEVAVKKSQPVFFRTQAIMHELQQKPHIIECSIKDVTVGQDNIQVHSLDVQAEEIVEMECTPEPCHEIFNPHDAYCIPGGPPEDRNEAQEQKPIILETYHTSTLKSTHSLAPKMCNMCGKVYSTLSNLRQHVNLVHTNSKSVECPMCRKQFKSELYMRRHLICSHNITPMKKESWREAKPSQIAKGTSIQQQMWSEMNAAVENLAQNIPSTS